MRFPSGDEKQKQKGKKRGNRDEKQTQKTIGQQGKKIKKSPPFFLPKAKRRGGGKGKGAAYGC